MNQPTEEQIQWFWEQCGFKYDDESIQTITYPDGHVTCWPLALDLNNLFKYAVPKLDKPQIKFQESILPKHWKEWYCSLKYQINFSSWESFGYSKDPALALFWAIYKALGGLNEKGNNTHTKSGICS